MNIKAIFAFIFISISFLNPQIAYMIFIYSQSLKQNFDLEDRSLECVSIVCHQTKPKVITTVTRTKESITQYDENPKKK